ncbi:MAG TPA: hypothetical protein DCE41_20635, partial [Cytophagales bacterium]|nr:hypothetical protein [Cytophagales bacterium]
LLTVWLTYWAVRLLYAEVYSAHFSVLVFRQNLFVFLIISLLYNAVYTGTHFFAQWRQSIVEAEELKRESLVSQLDALKNQINPHFLFNSINTLIGLIDEDPRQAKEYGHRFAEIYRQLLVQGKKELITLREEMEIVALQQQLFQARFGAGLAFCIQLPEEIQTQQLPPLTLQMLVENAVKHNVVSESRPLTIRLRYADDRVWVTNPRQPKNVVEPSTQTGLENIKNRYRFFTEQAVEVNEIDGEFRVSVPLLRPTVA